MARQLGDILVDAGIISSTTLERALERQKGSNQRLGQVLEAMGVLTETELLAALQHQGSPFGDQERKKQLGKILVQTGLISEKTLERALSRRQKSGKRLGELLEEMGVITEHELLDALGQQCGFKTVKEIAGRNYPPELLNLLPAELAIKQVAFPLKQQQNQLAVAVVDPLDGPLIDLITRITGLEVVPVIASRTEILEAVARHYLQQPVSEEATNTVLIAAHSPSTVAELQTALSGEPYRLLIATEGLTALQLIRNHRPHVVVVEQFLPKLDAYGVLCEMRNHPVTRDVPLIMMTDRVSRDDELQAFEDGFFDCILKPVQAKDALLRVKRALKCC